MANLKWHLFVVLSVCAANLNAQTTPNKSSGKQVFAKFGKGVNFIAQDSSMSLKLGARFQTLFVAEKTSGSSNVEKEMMIRRFRLKMDGFAFTPRLEYKIELALSNRDIGPPIDEAVQASNIVLDAVLKYQLSKNTELWFGQTKLPGNRERVISSQALQFVDRSIVNGAYNLDRDIGVQLHHSFNIGNAVINDKYAISLGQGRNVTASDAGGLSYTARVEVLPLGEFTNKGDYFDSDLERERTLKISLGAGYSYNDDAQRKAGELGSFLNESRDLKTFFSDVMLKYQGWSLTSEYMDKQTSQSPVLKDSSNFFQTGTGWNIQTGYLFNNNIEVAARYSVVQPSSAIRSANMSEKSKEYTLGISKYFLAHSLKVQSDISHVKDYADTESDLRFRLQVEFGL